MMASLLVFLCSLNATNMLKNYLVTAIRTLWRNKGISFINISGLAIGIAAAVFVFIWVQNETSYDNYHTQAKQIFRVTNALQVNPQETWLWEDSPYPLANAAQKEIPGIEKSTRVLVNSDRKPVVKINDQFITEDKSAFVDSNWFSLFDYVFINGTAAAFAQDRRGLVLGETKAIKFFGNTDVVGKIIRIDSVNYTVRAVIKDIRANSSFRFDVMMPMAAYMSNNDAAENANRWGNFNFISFVKLRPNADQKNVLAGFKQLIGKYRGKNAETHTVSLQPLEAMYFETGLQDSALPHGNGKAVYVFSILGILVIVIACINYVNITTAKASLRAKEISVRKIIGAGKLQLFFQFITESVLLSLVALILGVVLMQIALPVFNSITGKSLAVAVDSVGLWKILAIVFVLITILNGIYPALLLSSFRPMNVFRGKAILHLRDGAIRKGLVVVQFAFSMMLITGTIVVYRQIKYIQSTDPGYNIAQVFSVRVPYKHQFASRNEARRSLMMAMKNEFRSKPGIAAATIGGSEIVNVTSSSSGSADWDGRDTNYNPTLARLSADADFQSLFGLTLQSGRWFNTEVADQKTFLLNQTAAATLGIRQPILNERFSWNGDTGKIIGIVKDFHYKSMHEKVGPMIIVNNKGSDPYFFIKTKPGNIQAALASAKSVWTKFLPEEPFDYRFMDESFNNLYQSDLQTSKLVFIFSVLAIIISALGLFGLASFLTEQRTREIGIRKVLGASVQQLVTLLSKDFILLVLIAILIAAPLIGWIMYRWLENFAYRTEISWWIFAGAGAMIVFVALLTIGSQAIRAAMVNPVKNLRTE
jgi:putative ABC transport system permease protein